MKSFAPGDYYATDKFDWSIRRQFDFKFRRLDFVAANGVK